MALAEFDLFATMFEILLGMYLPATTTMCMADSGQVITEKSTKARPARAQCCEFVMCIRSH